MEDRIRLTSPYAVRAACARVELASQEQREHECLIRPVHRDKTWHQLKLWHKWAKEAAATDINEYKGHDEDHWIHQWKLEYYLPLLEEEARENDDQDLLKTLSKWRALYKTVAAEFRPFIQEQLAENSALSMADCTLEHFSIVLDKVRFDCASKGILLTIPEEAA